MATSERRLPLVVALFSVRKALVAFLRARSRGFLFFRRLIAMRGRRTVVQRLSSGWHAAIIA